MAYFVLEPFEIFRVVLVMLARVRKPRLVVRRSKLKLVIHRKQVDRMLVCSQVVVNVRGQNDHKLFEHVADCQLTLGGLDSSLLGRTLIAHSTWSVSILPS